MFVHDLYYNPTTYNSWAKTAREGIARYNAATGNKCVLMAYKGGFETIVPSPQPVTKPYRDERNHDTAYKANWMIAEQEFYAWEQADGFTGANVYSLSQYWNSQGWGRDDDQRQVREAGFNHHLVKPVDFDTMLAVLSNVAQNRHQV